MDENLMRDLGEAVASKNWHQSKLDEIDRRIEDLLAEIEGRLADLRLARLG